jgi:Tfp pilus assembly protein PilN
MINLLPYKEKKSIEKIRSIKMAQTIVVGLLFLATTSIALLVPTWITTISRLNIGKVQISKLEREGMIASGVDLASLEARTNLVQSKLASELKSSPVEFIKTIRSLTPKGIVIDRYGTQNGALIEVFGIAQNREILQSFIKTLESSGKVSLVDNPVSNFVKNKNGDFKLTLSFK